jgi:hypothetical protein
MSEKSDATNVIDEANVVSRIPASGVYKFREVIANRMGLELVDDDDTGQIGLDRLGKLNLEEVSKNSESKFQRNHKKVIKVLEDIERKHNYLMSSLEEILDK